MHEDVPADNTSDPKRLEPEQSATSSSGLQFSEPSFPPPGSPPSFDDFDSRPHLLEGGYWVSFDRMYWWDGSGWVLGSSPGTSQQPDMIESSKAGTGSDLTKVQALIGLGGLILFALFAYSVCSSMPSGPGVVAP